MFSIQNSRNHMYIRYSVNWTFDNKQDWTNNEVLKTTLCMWQLREPRICNAILNQIDLILILFSSIIISSCIFNSLQVFFDVLHGKIHCFAQQKKRVESSGSKINDWFTTYILIQTVYILLQDCRQSVSGCRGQITCKINSRFAVLFFAVYQLPHNY